MPKTILLVDDEPHVIRILSLALEKENYRVLTAYNGETALEILEEYFPDIVITDIDMPRMNGKELCSQIDKKFPNRNFLIIILTSRAERDHRVWASQIPNLEFLEKPISVRNLKQILENYFIASEPSQ
jgi:DNA-binding response OmpR family regulator